HHAGVEQVAVLARQDGVGGMRLVAYVVGKEGMALTSGRLRDHLRNTLPDYMIPAAFVMLESLPVTVRGKIDWRALPEPLQTYEDGTRLRPRTATEEILVEIWSEVLSIEKIGIEDNFFELGGHSILATQVMSRVRNIFGVEVPVRAIFESPSVQELA